MIEIMMKKSKRKNFSISVPLDILTNVDANVAKRESRTGNGSRSAFILEAIIEKLGRDKMSEETIGNAYDDEANR